MQWNCPAVEKYLGVIDSLLDKTSDLKECAVRLKDMFGLYNSTSKPGERYIASQAIIQIDNPVYDTGNLLSQFPLGLTRKRNGRMS